MGGVGNGIGSEGGNAAGNAAGKGRGKNVMEFGWTHRAAVWRIAVVLVVLIIILQNIEPTHVDLLFWSLPAVPKLVLMVVSALFGAVFYAAARSWFTHRRPKA
jgi:uncharacterized integral membrane protein